ncbi:cytoglobin-2-like [Alosa pseudoharengus]|uniref:cytoglobin-2-like n=1 Tax=Alosa pseudoharengus TaxID=34774 RepID=UPI003F8B8CC8
MGCPISTLASKPAVDTSEEIALVNLTDSQKEIIKESWSSIQRDITRAGIILFVRLFESHPECKEVFFEFREVDDVEMLRVNKELRAHGLRVMSFIEKSVARLDEPERLEMLAFDLGRKHYNYRAIPKYFMYVMPEFIRAIQPILKGGLTPELEDAWKALFLYLTGMMRQGYLEEERRQTHERGPTSIPSSSVRSHHAI